MTKLTVALFVTIPTALAIGVGGALLTDSLRVVVLLALIIGGAGSLMIDDHFYFPAPFAQTSEALEPVGSDTESPEPAAARATSEAGSTGRSSNVTEGNLRWTSVPSDASV